MNPDDRWLLPAGIDEVLPPDAARLEQQRRALLDLFSSWGYSLVVPPSIDFLDSLLTGMGQDLDLQTFKLTDQISGRLMGVRADMTPQVARIDAHSWVSEGPTRLCYLGTTLNTRPQGIFGSRSPMQVGAELYGHTGVESDVEILWLMVEALGLFGHRDAHVDVGHVGIFRGLSQSAGLSSAQERTLFDIIQRKARAEMEEAVGALPISADYREMLLALVDLNGGSEVLEQAERSLAAAPAEVGACVQALKDLSQTFGARVPDVSLHYDLADLRGYAYHTGIAFAAFVPGHGEEIARGGRYDGIGEAFGRGRPATGFSADVKTLAALASVETSDKEDGILAPWGGDAALFETVRTLREQGERVVFDLPGAATAAKNLGCSRVLLKNDGAWAVVAADQATSA